MVIKSIPNYLDMHFRSLDPCEIVTPEGQLGSTFMETCHTCAILALEQTDRPKHLNVSMVDTTYMSPNEQQHYSIKWGPYFIASSSRPLIEKLFRVLASEKWPDELDFKEDFPELFL